MEKNNLKTVTIISTLILISTIALTACAKAAPAPAPTAETKPVVEDTVAPSPEPTKELKPIRYGGQLYPEEFLLKGGDFFSKYGLIVEHTLI